MSLQTVDMERGNIGVSPESFRGKENKERILLPLESFQELDPEDFVALDQTFKILNSPSQRHRIINGPKNIHELYSAAKHDRVQINVVRDLEKPESENVLGTWSLTDGKGIEHEHFIGYVAVHPEMHGKGIGTQMIEHALYKSFYDGGQAKYGEEKKVREMIYMAVTLNRDYEPIIHVAKKAGLSYVWHLPEQIGEQPPVKDIFDWYKLKKLGRFERYDTERWRITLDKWMEGVAMGRYETLNRLGLASPFQEKFSLMSQDMYSGDIIK